MSGFVSGGHHPGVVFGVLRSEALPPGGKATLTDPRDAL